MTYKAVFVETEEGVSVTVPSLPGCASQGRTEQEAFENIQDALQNYLAVARDLKRIPENYPVVVRDVQAA